MEENDAYYRIWQIRLWLARVLGPTVPVEVYSGEKVTRVARHLYDFYGSGIFEGWGGSLEWIG